MAADSVYSSPKYKYQLSVPAGWVRIPDAELARLKAEQLPPQAQHLIYEVAFQKGSTGTWFNLPYVIVQVVPPERTRLTRLPTEAEFLTVVSSITGVKAVTMAKDAMDAAPRPADKELLSSQMGSMAKATVQTDVANRKFWRTVDATHPIAGPMKGFSAGAFMPTGSVVQLNAYSTASQFNDEQGAFFAMVKSIRVTP